MRRPLAESTLRERKHLRHTVVVTILHDLLVERGVLLIDGAMGTELFARGLGSGDPPEMWNVENPERVVNVHSEYIAAGSDIILTNYMMLELLMTSAIEA